MDPSRLQIEALNKSEPTTSVTKKAGIEIPAYFYVFGVRRILEGLSFIRLPVFGDEGLVDQRPLEQTVCFEPLPNTRPRLAII